MMPTSKEIHENAVAHGWWEEKRSDMELYALAQSELSEALEECRNAKEGWEDRFYTELADFCIRAMDWDEARKEGLVESFFMIGNYETPKTSEKIAILQQSFTEQGAEEAVELMYKLFDGNRLNKAIEEKHEYNKTRPYKHGKKF